VEYLGLVLLLLLVADSLNACGETEGLRHRLRGFALISLQLSLILAIVYRFEVVCLSANVAAVHRPRRPRQSPLHWTIERYYPEFERTYDERYAKRYGPPMLQTMEFLIDQDSILIHEE
jgi:hypothetical protein